MKTFRIIIDYIIILLVLFDYYSVYWNIAHDLTSDRFLYLLNVSVLFLGYLVNKSNSQITGSRNVLRNYYLFAFVLLLGIPDWYTWGHIYFAAIPLFFLYIANRESDAENENFYMLHKFSNIMVIISIISLIFWLGGSVYETIQPTGVVPCSWDDRGVVTSYHNLYFETQTFHLQNNTMWRNSGVFCEAPVYNLLLCSALCYELFLNTEYRKIVISVLVVTILSTMSTTGQLLLIAILFMFFLRYSNRNNKKVLLYIAMPIFLYIGYHLVGNILLEKSETGSFESRASVIDTMYSVFSVNPIMGSGINKFQLTDGHGVSNSFFHVLADGGIVLAMFYIYCWLIIPYKYYRLSNDNGWLMFAISFVFLFCLTLDYNRLFDCLLVAQFLVTFSKINNNENFSGYSNL